MDLKKHKLGERELQTMAKDVGMQGLLDREAVSYTHLDVYKRQTGAESRGGR